MKIQETYAGIPYELRKLKQAKRLSLKVSHDGRVWVSMPQRVSLKDARAFMQKHIGFVQTALDNVNKATSEKAIAKAAEPFELPVLGEWFPVRIEAGKSFRILQQQTPLTLVITIPNDSADSDEFARHTAFEYWQHTMIARANAELPARVRELAQRVGETVNRVSVRNQRTLWGSCVAARRTINVNWRCVLFPDEVRDYLILHELAHLRQANHSAAYWKQVEAWCPDYKTSERWLKVNGKRIMTATQLPR
jgi:predicted metal-dependent hydrolase